MAEQKFNVSCGFFNAIGGDRRYTAEEMNRPYRRVITNGVFATPEGTASTDLQVVSAGSGMTITVKAGEGIFANKWFENQSDFNLTVTSNISGLPRRDSIIVQVDNQNEGRTGNIVYREGIPAVNPQPPAIGTVDNVIEYRVANIYVASGATAINQDAIVDLRGSSECPWVTSLIKQVDTAALWEQYRSAFHDLYLSFKGDVLPFATSVQQLDKPYTTEYGNVSIVPIGIEQYDRSSDILEVSVNGFILTEDTDYIINGNNTVTLVKPVDAGTKIWFRVLKSSSNDGSGGSGGNTVVESVDLPVLNGFEIPSGSSLKLIKTGNVVEIRGTVKKANDSTNEICVVPNELRPASKIQMYARGDAGSSMNLVLNTSGILGLYYGTLSLYETFSFSMMYIIDTNSN